MFYTDVSRLGNSILFSGYIKGEKVNKKFQFNPSLYSFDKNGKFKGLDGSNLSEISFSSIKEASEYVNTYSDVSEHKIYGMRDWVFQWIAKELPLQIKFDPSLIKILSFDIEVDSDGQGFPNPDHALFPITAISFHFSTEPSKFYCISTVPYDVEKRTVLNEYDVIYYRTNSEIDLLRTFMSLWQNNSPDIITGYNSVFFDTPYLINRINNLFDESTVNCLSPWNKISSREKRVNNDMKKYYDILGVQQLDYMDIFKKFAVAMETPENYQLNTVAELVLGEGKVDYSEEESLEGLYRNNPQLFIDYSLQDTYLVVAMEKRLQFLQIAIMLAYKTGSNYIDTLGTTAMWDAFIHRVLLKENIIIPSKEITVGNTEYEGAYVKPPQVGIHKWVVSFDFASLYPNIIIQLNISPETIIKNERDLICRPLDFLEKGIRNPKPKYAMGANGVYFDKSKQGILPRLVEDTYNERVLLKNKMLDLERNLENTGNLNEKEIDNIKRQMNIYKNQQHTLKILLNSVYGALGSKYFRFSNVKIAEAITLTGQLAFHLTVAAVNKKLNSILKTQDIDFIATGDTDSVGSDTKIVINGQLLTIEEYFNSCKTEIKTDHINKKYIRRSESYDLTPSISKSGTLEYKPITYVMKHTVKKRMFKISDGKNTVIVTEDHSIIVKNKLNNKIHEIKPQDLNSKNHKIINIITTDTD